MGYEIYIYKNTTNILTINLVKELFNKKTPISTI